MDLCQRTKELGAGYLADCNAGSFDELTGIAPDCSIITPANTKFIGIWSSSLRPCAEICRIRTICSSIFGISGAPNRWWMSNAAWCTAVFTLAPAPYPQRRLPENRLQAGGSGPLSGQGRRQKSGPHSLKRSFPDFFETQQKHRPTGLFRSGGVFLFFTAGRPATAGAPRADPGSSGCTVC